MLVLVVLMLLLRFKPPVQIKVKSHNYYYGIEIHTVHVISQIFTVLLLLKSPKKET